MAKNKPIYPVDGWKIIEKEFNMEDNYRNETTFALSNGYIGTRGTFEEGYDFAEDIGLEGNFLNGFYESEEIRYGEWNFGFPLHSQSLLNLPNCKEIRLSLEGESFDLRTGEILSYERTLHMDRALLTREVTWRSPTGKEVQIHIKRFVSLRHRNRMMISYEVTPLNFQGELRFDSAIDAEVCNHTRTTNPLVDYGPFGSHLIPLSSMCREGYLYYEGKTLNTQMTMACGCEHRIAGTVLASGNCTSCSSSTVCNSSTSSRCTKEEKKPNVFFTIEGRQNETVTLEKYMAYACEHDTAELRTLIDEELKQSCRTGFSAAEKEQEDAMGLIWKGADIQIEGETELVQGLRFNLFHIFQAPGNDGKTGMGAKGLSGEGYEGHYFWDTEMYVLPVFIFTNPSLALKLLEFRYNTLEEARKRAGELGHPSGALYPWRTINGQEASTYFPLGTAQYHINADIAYAVNLYWEATGDVDFLITMGAEILCETARVWADVGCFADSRNGRYCICSVTGPDEYNAIVDNNFYTNLMARENLDYALRAVSYLIEHEQEAYERLAHKIDLQPQELKQWKKTSDNMYFPFDEKEQVFPQDDGFMMRKPWDDSRIPPEKRHLLYENYHPLFIFRQRMSKQADAILGLFLCRHQYDCETLKRNYDFYQRVTLHHSSLSTCIFGMLASEIGYHEEAYDYFLQSARMDLDDYHENFYAGIHAANMAGTWQALAFGFAGIQVAEGKLCLRPVLPDKWKAYSFSIRYQGRLLRVAADKKGTKLCLLEGKPLEVVLRGKTIGLQEGDLYEDIQPCGLHSKKIIL